MSIILDAIQSFFQAKQKENESLHKYTRKFKSCCDIMESQIGGPIILKKIIRTMSEYVQYEEESSNGSNNKEMKEEDKLKKELIKTSSSKFNAYIYLENSDQKRFGQVMKTLHQQQSFGNNQFPSAIMEASEILSNHLYKTNTTKIFQKSTASGNQQKEKKNEVESKNNQIPPTLSFAQLETRYYCCGKTGHKSPQCKHCNTIPKSEWAITKTKSQFALQEENNEKDDSTITTKESSISSKSKGNKQVGWSNVHYSFFQSEEMKDLVLLESDSTNIVFVMKTT